MYGLMQQRVGYGTIAGRKKLLGVVNWLPEKHSDFGICACACSCITSRQCVSK